MISQAIPVIEMMNGLEKPIKLFVTKKYMCDFCLSKALNMRFPNTIQYNKVLLFCWCSLIIILDLLDYPEINCIVGQNYLHMVKQNVIYVNVSYI